MNKARCERVSWRAFLRAAGKCDNFVQILDKLLKKKNLCAII